MSFRRFQHARKIVLFTLMTMLVSGCGAPDFSSMKPTAEKPAAKVLLVNNPTGWSQSAVSKLRRDNPSLEPLAVSVQSITTGQLQTQMDKVSAHKDVNLCIAVFPGVIPESAVQIAKQHRSMDFEFVGTAPARGSSQNIAQVVPNSGIVDYIAGWLAGSVNQPQTTHIIGMLTNGAHNLNKAQVEAVLAGLYSSDPTVVLQSDTNFAQPPSNTTNNALKSKAPAHQTVPAVNVEVTPLSANNANLLKQGHGVVFSGINATGSSVVMQPGPPTPLAVLHDLESTILKNWEPGARTVNKSPAIVLSGKGLPKGTKHALAKLNPSNVTSAYVSAAWKAIPKGVQQKWLTKAGL